MPNPVNFLDRPYNMSRVWHECAKSSSRLVMTLILPVPAFAPTPPPVVPSRELFLLENKMSQKSPDMSQTPEGFTKEQLGAIEDFN